MSFFETKEFKTLKYISERLKVKNTEKNVRLFLAYLNRCYRLAVRKYNNIGFDDLTGKYSWQTRLTDGWANYEG